LEYTPDNDPRMDQVLHLLDWSAFFYPSFVDNASNLYGIGILIYESDKRKIVRSGLFDILDFVSPTIFLFKASFFYLFKPVAVRNLEPFLIKENGLLFSGAEKMKIDGWRVFEKGENEILSGLSPIDQYTGRFNPLRHLIILNKELSKDERTFLLRAIDLGYPFKVSNDLYHIQSTTGSQSLRNVTERLFKSNVSVFSKLKEVLVKDSTTIKNPIPSTNSILLFFENLSQASTKFLPDDRPEMYIKTLSVDFIIPFKNDSDLKSLVKELNQFKENFRLKKLEISFSNVGRINSSKIFRIGALRYHRYRIRAISHFFNEYLLPMHYVPDYLEEFENFTIENALRRVDKTSYHEFVRKGGNKEEFWIKGARIILFLSPTFITIARKVIVNHFLDVLCLSFGSQSISIRELKNGLAELAFDIHFPMHGDYSVSERQLGLFFGRIDLLDKWTSMGAEYAMMGDLENAEKLLENARIALEADFTVLDSRGLEAMNIRSKLRNAAKDYRRLKIRCPDCPTEPMYVEGSSKEEIRKAMEENKKWRTALSKYSEGIKMKKQILEEHISGKLKWRMMRVANSMIRESGLQPGGDVLSFENNLSTFYAELLSAIQQNHGDYTPEWLGFIH